MSIRVSGAVVGEIHTLFRWGAMGTWTDGELMAQFLVGQDSSEAAFRVLIHRHGPMVLGVCRRILGDEHAAEDAFQATFLVLVKKARTLQNRDLLTNWLYGVALRVASKERARGVRRRVVERQAAEPSTMREVELDQAELRSVIDEEVRRLPERYRLPMVLCHFEGLRHEEVAQRLGCPIGTVESRLSRARERLRSQLERRGLAPTASAFGAVLQPAKLGILQPSLVEPTIKAAIASSANPVRLATTISPGLWLRIIRACGGLYSRTGVVATALIITAGSAAYGLGMFRADGGTPPASPPTAVSASTPAPEVAAPVVSPIESKPSDQSKVVIAKTVAVSLPVPTTTREKSEAPGHKSVAIARPISGITIDGRLDDWPRDLKPYPIQKQVLEEKGYDPVPRAGTGDPDAFFKVGYDREDGLIYLAVVVRDDVNVLNPLSKNGPESMIFKTDAVEVYVAHPRRGRESLSSNNNGGLYAETMPVLQYVGVPGEVSAYGDKSGANPSLLYSKTRERRTRMKYQRQNGVTTYEWAIQAYDLYPDRLTELVPGKRIGFDLAVVDKDSPKKPPAWMYWGPTWTGFKGWDSKNLGELILEAGP